MKDNYCIRADYVSNTENMTLETEENVFWTTERARSSGLYQWHAYRYAQSIVTQYDIKNVLDIGCGPGVKLVKMLSPITKIYGIDQTGVIDYCKKTHGTGSFFSDNFEDPQVELDVPFGLIVCSDVIEHMVNPDTLLDYIKRFSRKDTLVIFSTPDRDRLRGKGCLRSEKKEHIREWNADEFTRYLKRSGFTILDQRHMPPVKTALNMLFVKHVVIQIIRKRLPYEYNQVILCGRR